MQRHCNTLQHRAYYSARQCKIVQHTHTATHTHCNTHTLQHLCHSRASAPFRNVPATHCNTLHHTATHLLHFCASAPFRNVHVIAWTGLHLLQCVRVCCSVLQCVAVCCSVLQCVVVCRLGWFTFLKSQLATQLAMGWLRLVGSINL